MRYEPLEPISRQDFEQALRESNPERTRDALLRAASHDDRADLVEICRRLARDSVAEVRGASAEALAAIVRRRPSSDLASEAEQILAPLLNDPDTNASSAAAESLEELGAAVPGWLPSGSVRSLVEAGFAFDDLKQATDFAAEVRKRELGRPTEPDEAHIVLIPSPHGEIDLGRWFDSLAAIALEFDGEPYGWQLGIA